MLQKIGCLNMAEMKPLTPIEFAQTKQVAMRQKQ